jgi:hypothetical protein
VLPEPSADAVYEGRLPEQRPEPVRLEPARPGLVGENRLDVTTSAAVVRRLPEMEPIDVDVAGDVEAGVVEPEAWVPWCPECRLQPAGGPWSLGCAEYLANAHDAVHHHGSWTARAVQAEQVAAAAACLPAELPAELPVEVPAATGGVR